MNAVESDDRIEVIGEATICCPSFLAATVSDQDAQLTARIFRALADPARVRLLSMISNAGEDGACVCELVSPLELSQPTVSHHLKVLTNAGLLTRERRTSWVYYRVQRDALNVLSVALGAARQEEATGYPASR